MKKTLLTATTTYEAPELQLLDFAVEQGFANSIEDGESENWD